MCVMHMEDDMQWMPIYSAPFDGTLVWLYEPHGMGGFMYAGCAYEDREWYNNLDLRTQHPTHWMPLPEGPK